MQCGQGALQHCSWTAGQLGHCSWRHTAGPATWYSWNTHEELTTAVSWAVTLSPLGSYSRYLIAVSLQCGCSLQHCSIWAGPLTANHPSAAAANYANYVAAEPGGARNEPSQSFTVLGEGLYWAPFSDLVLSQCSEEYIDTTILF